MSTSAEREELARHFSPYDEQRSKRLAGTFLIEVAIDGRRAALRRPRAARKPTPRELALRDRARNFHTEEALAA